MFADITANAEERIAEITESLDFLIPLTPLPPSTIPRHINTAKGLMFVQLYGVIEITVNTSVELTIDLINSENLKLQELNPMLWGMALNPELDALYIVNRKKWDKRYDLFQKILLNSSLTISTDVMPTDGRNCGVQQLRSIWKTFNIDKPQFNDVRFRGRLQDIVDNRINIAHGNSSPADVGARFTPIELEERIADVNDFCKYFITVFEDYITNKRYLA